ncbi:MAG: hypothetical protein HQ478_02375 [Chloroflexi bacterium]|nr:hypothetical protein [Chloroflexota bacterium]
MVDSALRLSGSLPRINLGIVSRIPVGTIPIKWLGISFAFNLVTSLPFLLSTKSGTWSSWWSFPIDDSWIHLNYVNGLATQGCFCYNSGIWEAGATSWGWVIYLTPFYFLGNVVLGLDPVLVTKFAGLLLAAITTLLVYYLALRFTANRYVAITIAVAVTLEPTWVFLRLSGMEGVLVTTLVFASSATLLNRKWLSSGLLLGAAFWSRPEAGIYVGVAAGAGFIYWLARWDNREIVVDIFRAALSQHPLDQFRSLGIIGIGGLRVFGGSRPIFYLMGGPALALILWMASNYWINGHVFPNTYLAKNDTTIPLFPIESMRIFWGRGISDFQAWLSGWQMFVGIPLTIGGAIWIVRSQGTLVLGLVLFAPLLIFGVASGISFGDAGFNFFARRYVDPVVPLLLMLALVGVWLTLTRVRARVLERFSSRTRRVAILLPVYMTLGAFLLTSAISELHTHLDLVEDYSWNTRNVFDEDELAGQWIKRHTPPDASVLIVDAGAIRFFGERFSLDGVGLNSHEFIGIPVLQVLIDQQPDYVAIWEESIWDSLPNATKVARFETPRNTILGGGPVGIYRLDWTRNFVPADTPATADAGKTVIDSVNLGIKDSELEHGQSITFVSFSPEALGSINGVDMREIGISHDGSVQESFELRTVPGRDVSLILRYRSDALPRLEAPAIASVSVNGTDLGKLQLDAIVGEMAETTILVPGDTIGSSLTRFNINWDGFVTEFRWWTVDAGEGVLILPEIDPDEPVESVVSPLVGQEPPEGAVAFDQFGTSDGAPADLRVPDTLRHGSWWIPIDSSATFGIRNERLVESSLDPTRDHRIIIDARSPDIVVGADAEWTGSATGLVTRHDGEIDGSNWIIAWYTGESRQILLGRSVDGVFKLLGQVTRDWGPKGSVRRLEIATLGEEVVVLFDGSPVITAVDDALTANTFVGVFAKGETETSWDNFSIVPNEQKESVEATATP